VPENAELRKALEDKSLEELINTLSQYKKLHNVTDIDTTKRAIRAIEIEMYYARNPVDPRDFPRIKSLNIGLSLDRELRRERISQRLQQRLDEGMAEEIRRLLGQGLTPDELIYYGLEYKFITQYVIGELTYKEMFRQLEIAIHQFAKRQMTWFRGMERRGIAIQWIDATLPTDEKVAIVNQIATI
jgi:tRNA dimethylallyltransferase